MPQHLGERSRKPNEVAKLRRSLAQLRASTNPVPTVTNPGPSPKPMTASSAVWVTRKVRVWRTVASTATAISITRDDLFKALNNSTSFIKISAIACWNITNPTDNTNYVSLTVQTEKSSWYSGVTVGPWEDYGSNTSCAALKVTFPQDFATTVTLSTGDSSSVVDVSILPSNLTHKVQAIVADFWVRISL